MWANDVFLDRRMTILHFFCICHFLLIFFLLIMNMFFFGKYLQILHIYICNTMLHLFCILWYVLLVMGRFVLQFTCIFCIFAVHGRHGTVENASKNWSFRGFRTKYLGLECPSGIFPRYSLRQCKCWLNGMVTSKKRHSLLHLSNIL